MVKIRNFIRLIAIFLRHIILIKVYGMDISKTARISFGAKLDKTNPKGIHIGEESCVGSGTVILSHDFCKNIHADTYIGKRCLIGINCIIMCGIKIGDNCVIGAGSIVTKDVPSNCIIAGNPAKIIRKGISTKKFGQLVNHE